MKNLPTLENANFLTNIDKYQKLLNDSVDMLNNIVAVEEDLTDVNFDENYTVDASKFTVLTAYNMRWVKNASSANGAQDLLRHLQLPCEVLIKSWTRELGQMWALARKQNLPKLLEMNTGIYEVMTSYPRKVYFDIDKSFKHRPNEKRYLKQLLRMLKHHFKYALFSVSGFCHKVDDNYKVSFHIIINNYVMMNEDDEAKIRWFA